MNAPSAGSRATATIDAILAAASDETRETLRVLGELLGNEPTTAISPTQFATRQLGVDSTQLAATKYVGPTTSLAVLGHLLRLELDRHAARVVIGSPGDGQPPTWSQLDVGAGEPLPVPGRMIVFFPAGTLADVPLCILINDRHWEREFTVLSAAAAKETAERLLAEFRGRMKSPLNPLVVLDDIDLVLGHRDGSGHNGSLADFLSALDGVRQREDILTVATTNDPGSLDPAAQRSNRFDTVLTLPLPDAACRVRILERHLGPLGLPIDFAEVAEALEAASGADVKEVIRRTVLEHGESFTQDQLLDIAESGRWQAEVDRGRYLAPPPARRRGRRAAADA